MNLPRRKELHRGRAEPSNSDNDNIYRGVDIKADRPTIGKSTWWRLGKIVLVFVTVGATLLALDQSRKDKCKTVIGRLAVKMKMDSWYSNCQCMTHSLD